VPSEPPPAAAGAERYPLDEEPADETMAPSPRVVAGAAPRQPTPAAPVRQEAPPAAAPAPATDMPPPRAAAPAPAGAAPIDGRGPSRSLRRPSIPRARDPRDPLGHVLATVAETIDVGSLVPPEALDPERWREARSAIDAAIARLEREGGSPGDRESLASSALQEALGLGPLGPLLDDPGVLEIVIEGPSTILVDRGSDLAPVPGRFSSADQLVTIVGRLLARGGAVLDGSSAMVETTLPDGAHVIAMLPPVALRGPVIEIRRTGRAPVTGESLVQNGLLTNDMLGVLRSAIEARRNVVVVGPGEVGVGSVVSAIANLAHSDDRVLAIEASPELALSAPHVVRLSASSGVRLGTLLAQAPRLRSDRLVLDGVSGPETRDALVLLASRGAGCVLGVRTSPTGPALEHLEALAGLDNGTNGVSRLLASAIHVLVRVGRDANGARRIVLIAEVTNDKGTPVSHEIFGHYGDFQRAEHTPTFACGRGGWGTGSRPQVRGITSIPRTTARSVRQSA
jgi:pilus assembly protein CpaF